MSVCVVKDQQEPWAVGSAAARLPGWASMLSGHSLARTSSYTMGAQATLPRVLVMPACCCPVVPGPEPRPLPLLVHGPGRDF